MHTENNCDFSKSELVLLCLWLFPSLKSVCRFFFYFSEHTVKEKGVHISIQSSWPLFFSSVFISTKSIIGHMWDEGTAQEAKDCWSWNFIPEIFALLPCSLTHVNRLQPGFSNNRHPEIQLLPLGVAGIQNIWWSSASVFVFPTVKWRQQLLQRDAMGVVSWEL